MIAAALSQMDRPSAAGGRGRGPWRGTASRRARAAPAPPPPGAEGTPAVDRPAVLPPAPSRPSARRARLRVVSGCAVWESRKRGEGEECGGRTAIHAAARWPLSANKRAYPEAAHPEAAHLEAEAHSEAEAPRGSNTARGTHAQSKTCGGTALPQVTRRAQDSLGAPCGQGQPQRYRGLSCP